MRSGESLRASGVCSDPVTGAQSRRESYGHSASDTNLRRHTDRPVTLVDQTSTRSSNSCPPSGPARSPLRSARDRDPCKHDGRHVQNDHAERRSRSRREGYRSTVTCAIPLSRRVVAPGLATRSGGSAPFQLDSSGDPGEEARPSFLRCGGTRLAVTVRVVTTGPISDHPLQSPVRGWGR